MRILRNTRSAPPVLHLIVAAFIVTPLALGAPRRAGEAEYAKDDCPVVCGDTLVVPYGCTYIITDTESYDQVHVCENATLDLGDGARLEVRDLVVVDPGGALRVNAGDAETRPQLVTIGDLDISGHLSVAGTKGGRIAVRPGYSNPTVTLNDDGLITSNSGPVIIDAPLGNNGIIRANGASTASAITFTAAPLANSCGRFEVAENEAARMVFASGSGVSITGGAHFDVRTGRLEFYASVETNGGLRMLRGKIIVAATKTFKKTGAFEEP